MQAPFFLRPFGDHHGAGGGVDPPYGAAGGPSAYWHMTPDGVTHAC
jgi:hypothetical protein